MPSYLINEIPGIVNKTYLELGTFDNHHFSTISAASKTSVDIDHPADYQMSTDDFFAQISPERKWDIIYIDADHTWTSVLKDFNNSIRHLNHGGSIFLHDLYPENINLVKPYYCGDAYIFLHHLWRCNYPNVFVQNSDYGVTFVHQPKKTIVSCPNYIVSYTEFVKNYPANKLYSKEEMISIIKECYNG